jgi:hypothetical protein
MVSSCSIQIAHTASPSSSPRNRLSALRAALESDSRAPGNTAVFEAARHRRPALAPHASPSSALAVLSNRSSDRNAEKDALTRALVSEYQDRRNPLWAELLILAYLPMMGRLCGRLRRDGVPDDELWQLALLAFLETVASITRSRKWLCLSIRRTVERRVVHHLGRERKMLRLVYPTHPDDLRVLEDRAVAGGLLGGNLWAETGPARGPISMEPDERDAAIAFLLEHAGHALGLEDINLVTATAINGERLTDYVAQRYPDLEDVARRREYQRIKRRHSRAMAKLRHVLADEHKRLREARADFDRWPRAAAA